MPNFTGTSTSPCDVSNVFSTFRGLTNTAYAFAATYNENNQSVKIVNQYVKFSNVSQLEYITMLPAMVAIRTCNTCLLYKWLCVTP